MPVEYDDRARAQNRLHGSGLCGCEPDGDEALPIAAGESAAWTQLVEDT